MPETPLLSIGIPTYKRSVHLDVLLRNLLPQLGPEVELLVADNASPDDTQETIERHTAVYPALRCHRHAENIGFNRNYAFLLETMRGQWCCIIGDDEIIPPGYVDRLLYEIRQDTADILLSNFRKYTVNGPHGEPVRILNANLPTTDFLCPEDEELAAYFNQVDNLAGLFSFISNVTFRREEGSAIAIPPDVQNATFPHAYRFLLWLRNGGRLRYLADHVMWTIKGNDGKNFDDLIQRALLDLDGYALLADRLLAARPASASAFMQAVCREVISYVGKNIPMACLQRYLSRPESWRRCMDVLLQHGSLNGPLTMVNRIPSLLWSVAGPAKTATARLIERRYRSWTTPEAVRNSTWLQGAVPSALTTGK